MYSAEFDYHRASTLEEALSLLKEHREAKLLAGGHSLIPLMKLRLVQPAAVIDIARIEALRGITLDNGTLRVGSLTTHRELADSDELRSGCRILAEAAARIGDPQVRNKGTIGGNIAHADPASDLPAVLVAVEATVHVAGPRGERQVPAAEFFVGLLTSAVEAGEIITHIEVPRLEPDSGCCYLKMEHPASGYAVCGTAAVMTLADDETCSRARLCFNGVSATPSRCEALSSALQGKKPDDGTIDRLVDEHLVIEDPLSDGFASASYREHVARVFGKRALKQARDRARG